MFQVRVVRASPRDKSRTRAGYLRVVPVRPVARRVSPRASHNNAMRSCACWMFPLILKVVTAQTFFFAFFRKREKYRQCIRSTHPRRRQTKQGFVFRKKSGEDDGAKNTGRGERQTRSTRVTRMSQSNASRHSCTVSSHTSCAFTINVSFAPPPSCVERCAPTRVKRNSVRAFKTKVAGQGELNSWAAKPLRI